MGDTRLMVEINGEAGGLFSILAQVNRRLNDLQGVAGSSASGARHSLGQIEAGASSLEGSVVKAGVALAALRGILMGIKAVATEALDSNLALERSQRTLQMATGDGAAGMAFVRKIAKDLGLELVTTAQGYAMMSAAAKGTSMEGVKTQQVFTSVARATAAMGLSADQTHGVLLALSQMISKGKVQAEELRRQLGEHLPGAFNIAARAMGVTTAEFENLMRAGKVISADFLPKFAVELEKFLGDAPEKAANSLQANINRIKTAFQSLAFEAGQGGGSSGLSAALKEISDRLNSPETIEGARVMGANLGQVMMGATKLAGVLWELRSGIAGIGVAWVALKIGELLKGLGAWAEGKLAIVTRTLAVRQATIQESMALAGHTLNVKENAVAQVARAQASVVSSLAMLENTLALGALTQAEYAAQRAALLHTQARLAEAGAIAAAGTAGAAYSGVLAMMGGWIGVIALALGGLVMMWSRCTRSAEEAAASSKKFHDEDMATLAAWDELGKKAKELDAQIRSGKLSREELAMANQRMALTLQKLEEQYPGFLKYLVDEKGHQRSIAEALKLANDERERTLKFELDQATASKKALEDLASSRKAIIENMEREKGRGRPIDEASLRNHQKELKIDEEMLRIQNILVTQAAEKWDALAKAKLASKTPAAEGEAKARESKFEEELAKLAQENLKYREQRTLAQKEAVELEKVELDLAKEMDRFEKDRKKSGKEDGLSDQEFLYLATQAKEIAAKQRLQIREKYQGLELAADAKVQKIEAEQTRAHEDALYRMQDEALQRAYESGRISATQMLAFLIATEERRFEIEYEAHQQRLNLKNLEPEEEARIWARMEALRDAHRLRMQQLEAKQQDEQDRGSVKKGIFDYIRQSQDALANWRGTTLNLLGGVENAFSDFFQNIFKKGQTGAQKWDALWKGLSATVLQALSQMAAKWLIAAAAQAIFGKSQQTTALAAASGAEALAAAEYFAAYASMPFVGQALALGNIAVMSGVMAAMKAKALVGAAEGGWFDRPTLTVMGEGSQRELAVPEVSFKNWAGNLANNLLASARQSLEYQRMGGAFAVQAAGMGGMGGGPVFPGATIFTSNSSEMQDFLARARRGYEGRKD